MRIEIIKTIILSQKKDKLYFILLSLISIVCLSCEKREAYFHFRELKDAQWSKYDTLYFDIDSSSVVLNVPLDIHIELVNNSDYPYQNIWLQLQSDFGTDSTTNIVEKQYLLADNMGKWNGSGFGSSYQTSFIYLSDFVFTERRNYQLKVIQSMRDEPLYGLEKVGIKISLSDN